MAIDSSKKKRKTSNIDIAETSKSKIVKPNGNEAVQDSTEVSEEIAQNNDLSVVHNDDINIADIDQNDYEQNMEGYKEDNIKFSKDFKMSHFRTKLRGNNFITELRHFLYLANIKPKIISKYIEKRGKPLELAEAMERIDKTHLYHVSYICNALQLVLMEILTNEKSHSANAINASRYFLKSHGQIIEKLLKSPNNLHRKIILKLLAAIVCLEPQLGRQLLTSFDVLSNVRNIEQLLSHSKFDLNNNSNDCETVRKSFIHFILSYLIDGNIQLIRNVLEKTNLLKTVISGLIFDDYVTVCVVLNTFKKYVIENVDISKTKKLHVFDIECVKNLLKLYEWRGPKEFSNIIKSNVKSSSKKSTNNDKNLTDPIEKESVRNTVHELLIVLLTSRKYGIAFDSMTNFKQKHNNIQGKLIGSLDKPWSDNLKIDLVIKILINCPELARQTIKHYANCLNPYKTGNKYWLEIVRFLEKIIKSLNPKILRNGLDKITLTDYTYWIKDICLSAEIFIHLKGKNSLKSLEYEFRLATNQLLLAMYRQYCNYMQIILEREKNKGNTDLRRFKFDIMDYIFINFPTIENILLSLYLSIQQQENPKCNVLEHLELTLDLVLLICKQNRSFVNKTGMIIDYLKLLRPLYVSEIDNTMNVQIELKAVKTILLLMPNALQPNRELFKNVLTSFINIYVSGNKDNEIEAGNLLRGILLNTQYFQNGILEIDLWLESLKFIDIKTIPIICEVFVQCFQCKPEDIHFENSKNNEIMEKNSNSGSKNLQKLFKNIENNITIEGFIETPIMSKLLPLILNKIKIGEKLKEYLEIIGFLLYHYIPESENVYKCYSEHFTNHKEYMETWLVKKKPRIMTESIKIIPYYEKIYLAILAGEQTFYEIFKIIDQNDDNAFAVFLNNKEMYLNKILQNERLLMIYINQILFCVSQLTDTNKFDENHMKSCSHFLNSILQILYHLKNENDQILELTTIITIDAGTEEFKSLSYLEIALKYIYCNYVNLLQNFQIFSENVSNQNLLNFLYEITNCCNKFDIINFHEFTIHYRMKIIRQIEMTIEKSIKLDFKPKYGNTIKILECFHMSNENCLSLLDTLSKLSYKNFLPDIENSNKSIYFDCLIFVLNRQAELKKSIINIEIIHRISKIYIDLIEESTININLEINLDKFEESFTNLLNVSHQSIELLPNDLFIKIFEIKKITKSTVKLCTLILERNSNINEIFLKKINENLSKKELMYPLLNIAIMKNLKFDLKTLNNIYQEYKNGFIKTIEKPQKAGVIYKENVKASIYLINNCMPLSECIDFCNKNLKIDTIETFQLLVIHEIYKKAIESIPENNEEQYKQIFVNFLNTFIQLYMVVFRREYYDEQKISNMNFLIYNWIKNYHRNLEYNYEKIIKSQIWLNFCKNCLKSGMQSIEIDGIIKEGCSDINNSQFLKILTLLCNLFYENFSNHSDCKQLFEMIFSHSRFFEIILTQQGKSVTHYVKTETMNLLLHLVQKNIEILDKKHIPIYLGAYEAKLSNCDRYILALLQFYEENSINLYEYRPFIWGESAVAHYSIKDDDEKLNIQQQEPSVLQVMSLVDRQISENTIKHFPIWRKLNALKQLPQLQFIDPNCDRNNFGNNKLEIEIEQGELNFDQSFLKLCPKKDEILNECYDPAFIIPLMSMSFAPEIYSQPVRPLQNGLLGIVFAALSSQDKDMRLAAGCCQLRYRQHFENGKFFDKPIWSQAYDNIQNGLDNLQTDWTNHKKSGVPRVPYISGLFLAKSFNLLIDPTNPLYKILTMYLNLKENFNFLCIPEFNVLFHSPEIDHNIFRQFIIEIIHDGIKCSSDLILLITTNTFKALMGFYSSTMSQLDINLLILSVISICVKIPASSKMMIDHVGIIPWLNSVIEQIEYFHFDTIEAIISIISNLWYAIKAREREFYNYKHIEGNIYRLLIKLSPNISGRISLNNFTRFLNILQKTAYNNHKALPEEYLARILNCAQRHFDENIWYIENIKLNGASGVENQIAYFKKLKEQKLDNLSIQALLSLREFIIEWKK